MEQESTMTRTKHKSKSTAKVNKYQAVTDKIIHLLEQDIKPWEHPWRMAQSGNLITGHKYRGINPILVQVDMLEYGYKHPYFLSFNQAKEQGWSIKKGSKATPILWAGSFAVESENDNGETIKEYRSTAKWYNLFNIACIDDSQAENKIADFLPESVTITNPDLPITELEEFITKWQVPTRKGGDRAAYSPSGDFIRIPNFEKFTSAESYYGTWFHECGHSTGHHSRLNRDMSGRFGSPNYAREELIAELTHVYLATEFKFNRVEVELEQNADYIKGWLSLLKSDSKAFFKASTQAQKATKYILEQANICAVNSIAS